MEIGQINVPTGGPLGFLIGMQVSYGVGAEIGGKLKLADAGIELKGSAAAINNKNFP